MPPDAGPVSLKLAGSDDSTEDVKASLQSCTSGADVSSQKDCGFNYAILY